MQLKNSPRGFTLVEIMIVVAIIALLAAIAVPGFLRARKRAQASRILNDLRLIAKASLSDVVDAAFWSPYQ
jgi:prepilin-type N-terminal cleavage/methylation domain-containing protein